MKQRLVGGAVIVALGVIFIPMILDGPPPERAVLENPIPPKPDGGFATNVKPFGPRPQLDPEQVVARPDESLSVAPPAPETKPVQIPEPKPVPKPAPKPVSTPEPESTEPPPAVVRAPEPEPPRPVPASPPPRPTTSTSVTAWVVQVGSFSSEKNARSLRDRLRKKGFNAFAEPVLGAGDGVTRVYIGPELDRDEAVAAGERLSREMQMNGLVVRYP